MSELEQDDHKEQICEKLIDYGMILRYLVTLITFYTLSVNLHHKIIRDNLLFILPVLMVVH